MNKISTNVMAILAIWCLSLFCPSSVSAADGEYKSMIRYDRIWEHVSYDWSDRDVYHVRFDGSEEFNGKTYHRLVCFRKASYGYDSAAKPYLFDVNNDYYLHEGYLREEDGKVYTLLEIYDRNGNDSPYICLCTDLDEYNKNYTIEERLLYDFTCKEGESYKALHLESNLVGEMIYEVKSVDLVEIQGEPHRIFRVIADGNETMVEPIIEGVGIVSYGCLTTINFLYRRTCPCMNHIFNRLLSSDGEVLYCAEEGYANIPYGDFSGVDNVIANTNDSESLIYDMMGRRILEAAPGQLYIRDGKKYIGK